MTAKCTIYEISYSPRNGCDYHFTRAYYFCLLRHADGRRELFADFGIYVYFVNPFAKSFSITSRFGFMIAGWLTDWWVSEQTRNAKQPIKYGPQTTSRSPCPSYYLHPLLLSSPFYLAYAQWIYFNLHPSKQPTNQPTHHYHKFGD